MASDAHLPLSDAPLPSTVANPNPTSASSSSSHWFFHPTHAPLAHAAGYSTPSSLLIATLRGDAPKNGSTDNILLCWKPAPGDTYGLVRVGTAVQQIQAIKGLRRGGGGVDLAALGSVVPVYPKDCAGLLDEYRAMSGEGEGDEHGGGGKGQEEAKEDCLLCKANGWECDRKSPKCSKCVEHESQGKELDGHECPGCVYPIEKATRGCVHCRKSRKGCDKFLPSCGRCVEQGKTCSYDAPAPGISTPKTPKTPAKAPAKKKMAPKKAPAAKTTIANDTMEQGTPAEGTEKSKRYCVHCRKSRKPCDKSMPTCGRCAEDGKICSYDPDPAPKTPAVKKTTGANTHTLAAETPAAETPAANISLTAETPAADAPTQKAGHNCGNCRKVKQKCDKDLPTCGRCAEAGKTCSYDDDEKAAKKTVAKTLVAKAPATKKAPRKNTPVVETPAANPFANSPDVKAAKTLAAKKIPTEQSTARGGRGKSAQPSRSPSVPLPGEPSFTLDTGAIPDSHIDPSLLPNVPVLQSNSPQIPQQRNPQVQQYEPPLPPYPFAAEALQSNSQELSERHSPQRQQHDHALPPYQYAAPGQPLPSWVYDVARQHQHGTDSLEQDAAPPVGMRGGDHQFPQQGFAQPVQYSSPQLSAKHQQYGLPYQYNPPNGQLPFQHQHQQQDYAQTVQYGSPILPTQHQRQHSTQPLQYASPQLPAQHQRYGSPYQYNAPNEQHPPQHDGNSQAGQNGIQPQHNYVQHQQQYGSQYQHITPNGPLPRQQNGELSQGHRKAPVLQNNTASGQCGVLLPPGVAAPDRDQGQSHTSVLELQPPKRKNSQATDTHSPGTAQTPSTTQTSGTFEKIPGPGNGLTEEPPNKRPCHTDVRSNKLLTPTPEETQTTHQTTFPSQLPESQGFKFPGSCPVSPYIAPNSMQPQVAQTPQSSYDPRQSPQLSGSQDTLHPSRPATAYVSPYSTPAEVPVDPALLSPVRQGKPATNAFFGNWDEYARAASQAPRGIVQFTGTSLAAESLCIEPAVASTEPVFPQSWTPEQVTAPNGNTTAKPHDLRSSIQTPRIPSPIKTAQLNLEVQFMSAHNDPHAPLSPAPTLRSEKVPALKPLSTTLANTSTAHAGHSPVTPHSMTDEAFQALLDDAPSDASTPPTIEELLQAAQGPAVPTADLPMPCMGCDGDLDAHTDPECYFATTQFCAPIHSFHSMYTSAQVSAIADNLESRNAYFNTPNRDSSFSPPVPELGLDGYEKLGGDVGEMKGVVKQLAEKREEGKAVFCFEGMGEKKKAGASELVWLDDGTPYMLDCGDMDLDNEDGSNDEMGHVGHEKNGAAGVGIDG